MCWKELNKKNLKVARRKKKSGCWNIRWKKAVSVVLLGDNHAQSDIDWVQTSTNYQAGNLLSQEGTYICTLSEFKTATTCTVLDRSQFESAVCNAGAKKKKFEYIDKPKP